MRCVKAIPLAISAIAISLLAGCAITPPANWTDKGTGTIATRKGFINCYTDANLIDGKRTEGTLCATAVTGFLSDGEPGVFAGVGYGRPFKIEISKTFQGYKLPFADQTGLLKCDPLKTEPGKTIPESICTLTLNDQKLVSARIIFDGMN
ncbi:hypothetical protein [Pseudomonas maumuensis]|uniref:Lipoprotein n=1 Tax=Pseudomonas maumuensis TaxID=2842354 RepID=A0ABX8NE56_9PSED|nr:hypothetical protein [Pseudomonas maumuensis]QXH54392.1 hypothetical protein KSS90_13505 [Pseudomonas maumuensis]